VREVISRLEKLLSKEINTSDEKVSEPMTVEELNKQIDQSESDLANNRFKLVPNYLSSTINGF
jgi:hypothetical protein